MLPSALATIAESPDCNASRAASTDSDVAVSRENLYRALSGETAPEFGTVTKVLRALGIKLVARAKPDKAAKRVCGSASWPQTMERLRKSRWVNARNGRSRPAGYCSDYKCSHSVEIIADQWPNDVRLFDLELLFTCQACGLKGAEVRADFNWQAKQKPPGVNRWDRRPSASSRP
jgi:ribosomal protein L37E